MIGLLSEHQKSLGFLWLVKCTSRVNSDFPDEIKESSVGGYVLADRRSSSLEVEKEKKDSR